MKSVFLILTSLICFAPVPLVAQPDREVVEFAQMYNERFEQRKPLVGMRLPDASAFDEEGKPFDLSDTRGKYTVLTFGCLT